MVATSFLSLEEIRTALLDALKTLRKPEEGVNRTMAHRHVSDNTPERSLNGRRWTLTLAQALSTGEVETLPSGNIRITQKGLEATESRQKISREDLRRAIRKVLTTSSYQAKPAVHAKVCKSNAGQIVTALDFAKAWAEELADGSIEESSEGLRRKPKK